MNLILLIILIVSLVIVFVIRNRKIVSMMPKTNTKDDESKDDSSSKAKEMIEKVGDIGSKAGDTAKGVLSSVADIVRSVFWWGILIAILYLIINFGWSMYKGVSDFMSDSVAISSVPVSTSTIRIIDGDFVPDKTDGTYLFRLDANKSYRIKVSGCGVTILDDGVKYKVNPYKLKVCADGSFPEHNYKKFVYSIKKGALFPNVAIAALVIKKDGEKIAKKLPIGDNLYTLNGKDFPGGKVYLYISLNIHETVYSGEWHVVVDEII